MNVAFIYATGGVKVETNLQAIMQISSRIPQKIPQTGIVFVFGQDGGPMFKFVRVLVDEIVKHGSRGGEFDRFVFVAPPFAEVDSTVAHLVNVSEIGMSARMKCGKIGKINHDRTGK